MNETARIKYISRVTAHDVPHVGNSLFSSVQFGMENCAPPGKRVQQLKRGETAVAVYRAAVQFRPAPSAKRYYNAWLGRWAGLVYIIYSGSLTRARGY